MLTWPYVFSLTPLFFPPPPLLAFSFLFFGLLFLVFPTNPVVLAIPLLILRCFCLPSTVLCRSSPPWNWLSFRSSFSNFDLVSSTSFAQPHANPPCSHTPQLPIGAKQRTLFHPSCASRPVRFASLASGVVVICWFIYLNKSLTSL